MRIRAFSKLIRDHLQPHTLNDKTVVIDGHLFFYSMYENSGLQFVFGCESNRYAAYLRNYLSMFKKANVRCYFVFKGGLENIENRWKSVELDQLVVPLFTRQVCMDVLDEMDFKYTVCEFEAKKEIVALAQQLKCPIVSFDIEYVFYGQFYIPYPTINFNEHTGFLTCGFFYLNRFLNAYRLNNKALATFAALTDENNFTYDFLFHFLESIHISITNPLKRNIDVLRWLGRTGRDGAVSQILQLLSNEDRDKFLQAENKVYQMGLHAQTPGIPTQYMLNEDEIIITERDPEWFQKGIASKHIPIDFITIYFGHVLMSYSVADNSAADPQMLSMDIIKYAFNLLTNYKKRELNFYPKDDTVISPVTDSVQKPDNLRDYNHSLFENGWNSVPTGLFDHFLCETLGGHVYEKLQRLPEDSRLLMVALIYFAKHKRLDVTNEVLSILLSYIALTALSDDEIVENADGFLVDLRIPKNDKDFARSVLKKYFAKVYEVEARRINNLEWLHQLVEFQECLQILNHLNTLCGRSYKATLYHKTYNGTFVYLVLKDIKNIEGGNGLRFVENILNQAPTVLRLLLALNQFVKNNIVP